MNNKVKFLRGTAAEYANAVKDDDTFYYTTDDEKFYVGSKEITGGGITVDSELSDTSTNPVYNKVIKAALDDKADKAVATTTADGLMSASDKTKLDNADDTYALKSKYGNTTINVGRKADTTVGDYSTAEGRYTTARGTYSHAEGYNTVAIGASSHAEGYNTVANGLASHATGEHTIAIYDYEVACGVYNKSNYGMLFSIGDGTSDDARHNAFEITKTGGKLHDKNIATVDNIPTSLPANGGNADTVNNHTVNSDVPANAVFTDTWRGIQDNLTSNSTTDSLSANQGKVLNEKIAEHTDNSDIHVTASDKKNWNSHPNDVQASGNPVQLSGLQGGVPFADITVCGEDIIGQEISVSACGKNLIPYPYTRTTETVKGVDFTDNGDGTITINGTATDSMWYTFTPKFKLRKNGRYTFSCGANVTGKITMEVGDGFTVYLSLFENKDASISGYVYPAQYSDNVSFTADYEYAYVTIRISRSSVIDNVVIKPQLELGSTATPYEPYHGSTTTITPDSNPYTIPNDIRQLEGHNVISVSAGELSVVGVKENAAIKKIWDEIDKIKTAIIVSNGEIE